jgi:hypothetical protein
MLRCHPGIYMPDLKEPRYLESNSTELPGWLPQTLDEYLALFEPAASNQLIGEASPQYLRSQTAAAAIADLNPHARCIAILREPASHVRAFHLHLLRHRVETEPDLRKAVADEEVVRQGRVARRYSDAVDYVVQLQRFHELFPKKQLLVLVYEEFRDDNEGTVREVLRFLGVDADVPVAKLVVNQAIGIRSVRLHGLIGAFQEGRGPVSAGIRRVARAVLPAGAANRAFERLRVRTIYSRPAPPDEAVVNELRERYRPNVVALSEYLGRDMLSFWGYDDVT